MSTVSDADIKSLDKCDVINERFLKDLFYSYNILPNSKMNKGSKCNACLRLSILIAIIMYLMNYKYTIHFISISFIIIFLYSYNSKESFSNMSFNNIDSPSDSVKHYMNSLLPLDANSPPRQPFDLRTDNIPSQPEFVGDLKKNYNVKYPRHGMGKSYDNDSWGIKAQQGIIGVNNNMNTMYEFPSCKSYTIPTFFSPYLGFNPKQNIRPIIIDRALQDEIWDMPINIRSTINKRYVDDVTELELGINCQRSDGSIIPDCTSDSTDVKVAQPYSTETDCPYVPPKYGLATPIKTSHIDNYTKPFDFKFNKPEHTEINISESNLKKE